MDCFTPHHIAGGLGAETTSVFPRQQFNNVGSFDSLPWGWQLINLQAAWSVARPAVLTGRGPRGNPDATWHAHGLSRARLMAPVPPGLLGAGSPGWPAGGTSYQSTGTASLPQPRLLGEEDRGPLSLLITWSGVLGACTNRPRTRSNTLAIGKPHGS